MERIVTHHFPKEDLLLLLTVISQQLIMSLMFSKLRHSHFAQKKYLGCVMLWLCQHLFRLSLPSKQ